MYRIPIPVVTIGLLSLSNLFMTFAWYGHLKFRTAPLMTVILISWGIAFFEYLLQVPANRIGYGTFNAAQIKTIQEVITLTIFVIFSSLYLGEPVTWNQLIGFACIALGAFFIFPHLLTAAAPLSRPENAEAGFPLFRDRAAA